MIFTHLILVKVYNHRWRIDSIDASKHDKHLYIDLRSNTQSYVEYKSDMISSLINFLLVIQLLRMQLGDQVMIGLLEMMKIIY